MSTTITRCLLAPGIVAAAISAAMGGPVHGDRSATEVLNLGLRGVYFVPNQGQWSDGAVHYGLRSRGLDVAFRASALTMHLRRENGSTSRAGEQVGSGERLHGAFLADASGSLPQTADFEHLTLTVTFPGSNEVEPTGGKPQAARFNYFVGGEGRRSASDVPSFGEVVYLNLYDGIDLHVMGNDDGVLKYEFHVAPGADYSRIRIAYAGIESLCIDESGDLHISTSFGTLADGAPVVWQEAGGTTVPAVAGSEAKAASADGRDARSTNATIPARLELCDAHTYRIALDGPVDPARELIIDPDVDWMTYLGGADSDDGYGMAVDSSDNALVTGSSESTDFEGRSNAYRGGPTDAFVVKLRVADGPQLSVVASCPSGGPIQVSWSGATSGGTIALLYAHNTGSFRIPNGRVCTGTVLGLGASQIQIVFQGSAGPDGSRTLNSTAGPGACGGYLQLLDVATCGTSNVARIE